MKTELPENHALSSQVLAERALLPVEAGKVSITDVQYASLQNGIARGVSVLVSAPTSTGKTLIGWWAAASALESGKKVVYLVSHRALARQKFEEVETLFLDSWLYADRGALVCATGDGVEDSSGRKCSSPLAASVLIATYEKYLALLTAGGPPQDLKDTVFICDEVQLIGDGTRGKHVELLLSVLKRCGWHQLVALSAVMDSESAQEFSDWLDLQLVRVTAREKAIQIECRGESQILVMRAAPEGITGPSISSARKTTNHFEIIRDLLATKDRSPVIVFCMKVDDTYDLCRTWAARASTHQVTPSSSAQDIDPTLLGYISQRCAYHNAELSDAERKHVEDAIRDGLVDVVFATTTLAAGVNFPLGSALFYKWKRWNFEKKVHEPIGRAEFQNMAGRVGRMGQHASEGYVIATAETALEMRALQKLTDMSLEEKLGKGISPTDFGSLVLQLFAGKLCETKGEAFVLLASTLSALREAAAGRGNVDHWRRHVDEQVDRLVQCHCLVDVGSRLVITPLGAAVAGSSLKPETALYFLNGLADRSARLQPLLPGPTSPGADDDLLFILTHAALVSPEFDKTGGPPQRSISWRFSNNNMPIRNEKAARLNDVLFERPWVANPQAANASVVLSGWASGVARDQLEATLSGVRIGLIHGVARDVSWVLSAVAQVILTVSSPALDDEAKPPMMRGDGAPVEFVRRFGRILQRYATRIASGLPSPLQWMLELELKGPNRRLSRSQILMLAAQGIIRPHQLMDGSSAMDTKRLAALPLVGRSSPANLARDAARAWKVEERRYFKQRHLKFGDALGIRSVVEAVYDNKGVALETAVAALVSEVGIVYHELDDGKNPGYPDARLDFSGTAFKPIILELKSKISESDLVSQNDATEVIAAALVAGYPDHPCLTVCSPGVEPSVPTAISAVRHLSIVEVVDLVEAVLRLKAGNLSVGDFYNWITSPGLCLREDLPYANL